MSVDREQRFLSVSAFCKKKKKNLRKLLQNAEEGVSALSIREFMCVCEKLCYSCCCCHVVVGLLKFSGF